MPKLEPDLESQEQHALDQKRPCFSPSQSCSLSLRREQSEVSDTKDEDIQRVEQEQLGLDGQPTNLARSSSEVKQQQRLHASTIRVRKENFSLNYQVQRLPSGMKSVPAQVSFW